MPFQSHGSCASCLALWRPSATSVGSGDCLSNKEFRLPRLAQKWGSQVMPRLMGKMRIWTSGFRIWILQTNLCEPWSCGWLRILYGRSKTPELPLKSLKLRILGIHSDSHPKKKLTWGQPGETKTPQPGAGCIARSSEMRSGRIQAATAKVQRGNSNSSAKVRGPESDKENIQITVSLTSMSSWNSWNSWIMKIYT